MGSSKIQFLSFWSFITFRILIKSLPKMQVMVFHRLQISKFPGGGATDPPHKMRSQFFQRHWKLAVLKFFQDDPGLLYLPLKTTQTPFQAFKLFKFSRGSVPPDPQFSLPLSGILAPVSGNSQRHPWGVRVKRTKNVNFSI